MPNIKFLPQNLDLQVDEGTKILIAARKAQIPLRFGCASCRCGTCAVSVEPSSALTEMKTNERELLARMKLAVDGSVRLSCQAKIKLDTIVDIAFQDTYSPDDGDEF